jgi:hypothetical protein
VNEEVVKLFAGSAVELSATQARGSIARLCAALPLVEANRMQLFASRLASRDASGRNAVGEMRPR